MKKSFSCTVLSIITSMVLFAQQKQLAKTMNDAVTVKNNFVKREVCYSFLGPADSVIYCDNHFDAFGRMVVAKSFTIQGQTVDIDTILYKNDLPDKEMQYDSTGKLIHTVGYSYSNEGKLEKITKYDSAGKIVYFQKREYDGHENLISVYIKGEPDSASTTTYEFDENNRIIRTTCDTGRFKILRYKYNRKNQLVSTLSNNELYEMKIKFFYNKKGLWVKRKYNLKTSLEKDKITTEEYFSYYPNNLFFEHLYYENGELKGKTRSYYLFYK